MEVLDKILQIWRATCCTPSIAELSRAMGMGSPGGAYDAVRALEREGLLYRVPGRHRGLVVTAPGVSLAVARQPPQTP